MIYMRPVLGMRQNFYGRRTTFLEKNWANFSAEDPQSHTSFFSLGLANKKSKSDSEIKDLQERIGPDRYSRGRCFFGPAKEKELSNSSQVYLCYWGKSNEF
jgi:hypothetical protein